MNLQEAAEKVFAMWPDLRKVVAEARGCGLASRADAIQRAMDDFEAFVTEYIAGTVNRPDSPQNGEGETAEDGGGASTHAGAGGCKHLNTHAHAVEENGERVFKHYCKDCGAPIPIVQIRSFGKRLP